MTLPSFKNLTFVVEKSLLKVDGDRLDTAPAAAAG